MRNTVQSSALAPFTCSPAKLAGARFGHPHKRTRPLPSRLPPSKRPLLPLLYPIWVSVALLWCPSATAEVPLSIGTEGAAERASILANANRDGSAASFGSHQPQSAETTGFRWRLPLLLVGGESPLGYVDSRSIPAWSWTPTGTAFAFEQNEFLSALIPQFRLGHAGKPFHLQAGVISGSVGNETLVSQFTNSPEGASRRVGLLLEGNLMGGGAELMVGDVFDAGAFFAARVHARPLVWVLATDAVIQPNDQWFDLRSKALGLWKTGIAFAMDAHAPLDNSPIPQQTTAVMGFTWDNELELLQTSMFQAKLHVDTNLLTGTEGGQGLGAGIHMGAHSGFDFLGLRVVGAGEYRAGSDGYIPRYFDRLYMLERQKLVAGHRPKAAIAAPASHGFQLRIQASLWDHVSAFWETSDLFAFDSSAFANNGRMTVGLSTWLWPAGLHLTLSQTGIRDYLRPAIGGAGFVAMGEVRAALLYDWVFVVGRYWRIHQPLHTSSENAYNVEEGALIGLETRFGL